VLNLNTWHAHGECRPHRAVPGDGAGRRGGAVGVRRERSPLITSLRDIYPYHVECTSEPPCALRLLSRVPLEASGSARISSGEPSFVWARINPGQQGSTTIIGTQLNRPSGNPWRHEVQMRELAPVRPPHRRAAGAGGNLNTSPWSQSFRALRWATGLSRQAS
jgi:endonuclease/exonuclease/phosphatase (EEP) superfamily protein YafD